MATRTAVSPTSSTQHITVLQLAHRWNVTTDYLYRDCLGQPDGIPFMRIGKGRRARIRIKLSDVERWEEEHVVQYGIIERKKRK